MQQKSGGPPINCSYPSDQRGLQGVYPSSADCGLNNSSPAKAESQNMQPKVIFYPHDQHFTASSHQHHLLQLNHLTCMLLFSFLLSICGLSLCIIVFCCEVHFVITSYQFSSYIPWHVSDISFTRRQRQIIF